MPQRPPAPILIVEDNAETQKALGAVLGITGYETVTADDGSFDSSNGTSATLSSGQTFSHAFSSPGTFPYHCKIHGGVGGVGMSGVIVVQAATTPTAVSPTTAATSPAPAAVAPGQMALTGRPIAQALALGLLAVVLGSVLKVTAKRTLA